MSLIPDEKVPDGVESKLSEYLQRMFHFAKLSDDTATQLVRLTAVPNKPITGKLYYFSSAVATTPITAEGYWGYKSTGWVQLG